MSDKSKNKKVPVKNFILYHKDKMTGKERNLFERELQKDLFAEEAEEGFSQLPADVLSGDVTILQNRLTARLKKRRQVVFYRIAAAVTILIVVSGIILVSRKGSSELILSDNIIKKEVETPFSIRMPDPITGPPVISKEDSGVKAQPATNELKTETEASPVEKKDLQIPELQRVESENIAIMEPVESEKAGEMLISDDAGKKSLSEGVNSEIARASAMPAAAKSEIATEYIEPQPVVGIDSFNVYIEKNIRVPALKVTGEKVVVVVNFTVNTDSTLRNIKVISSPGAPWSEEAIRLIKEGPEWKPALTDGFPTEASTSFSIGFD